MQSRGQPHGQPHGQLPLQIFYFIELMLLAASLPSGNMLQRQGFLKTGEELLHMSQESRRCLLQNLAEQRANLTSKQRQKLIQSRLRAVLVARFLGRQSWQHAGMTLQIRVDILRHLMTAGIPRIRITPISIPRKQPTISYWHLPGPSGSVIYDPSGYICDGSWSQYSASIEAITTHPRQPLIALIGSDGKVWIGKLDDPKQLFHLIHDPKPIEKLLCCRVKTCAFHPSRDYIAVAITGFVIIYKIETSLQVTLVSKIRFHEDPIYFCTCPPQFSACELQWHPSGSFFTAISDRGLSKSFLLDPVTFNCKGESRYAYLYSFPAGHVPPSCSCFSENGSVAVTGYADGTIMIQFVEKNSDGISFRCLKIINKRLPGHSIKKIVPHPCYPSIFAIATTSSSGWNYSVHLLKISPDGSIKILETIQNARNPCFYEKWFLVSSGNRILFHHQMNGDKIPVLMTEFHAQGTIGPFILTSANGKVRVYCSRGCGGSELHMVEITLQ